MTIYQAYFRTDAEWATEEFQAATPEEALQFALNFYHDRTEDLSFEPYTGEFPVNQIAIHGPTGEELAVWLDDDLRLALAARYLLDAAELARRELRAFYAEDGDSEALRALSEALAQARGQP